MDSLKEFLTSAEMVDFYFLVVNAVIAYYARRYLLSRQELTDEQRKVASEQLKTKLHDSIKGLAKTAIFIAEKRYGKRADGLVKEGKVVDFIYEKAGDKLLKLGYDREEVSGIVKRMYEEVRWEVTEVVKGAKEDDIPTIDIDRGLVNEGVNYADYLDGRD